MKNVRISVEDVICTVDKGGDPREYLYPIERDLGILGAYVAALVARDGGGVEGFLRFVAVHHIACTVWGDLDLEADTRGDVGEGEDGREEKAAAEAEAEVKRREEMRARLLRVVLVHGEADMVRDVVLYRQRSRGALMWPPTCYRDREGEGEDAVGWREERVGFVRRAMGEGAADRVGALLMPNCKT